jgi:hypothetical protein
MGHSQFTPQGNVPDLFFSLPVIVDSSECIARYLARRLREAPSLSPALSSSSSSDSCYSTLSAQDYDLPDSAAEDARTTPFSDGKNRQKPVLFGARLLQLIGRKPSDKEEESVSSSQRVWSRSDLECSVHRGKCGRSIIEKKKRKWKVQSLFRILNAQLTHSVH